MTLNNVAINLYKKQIEQLHITPHVPQLQEVLKQVWKLYPNQQPSPILPRGWALEENGEAVQFTAKQRTFLIEKFDYGIRNRKKFHPKDVAQKMRKNNLFEKTEFLTFQQISSFWSRLAKSCRNEKIIEEVSNVAEYTHTTTPARCS